ncbi:MAG: hypothetical protein K9M45_08985 [Kiritimatiellales bacterium]|nr:hypothetical protein [Kiritimatiellales bacterium]
MKKKLNRLNLVDMDIGFFVSYEMSADALTTKLFHLITLGRIPLREIHDFHLAAKEDITGLNHLNWFSFVPWHRSIRNVYTLQATEKSPRIFMRLDRGSHHVMRNALDNLHSS